jgi:methionyl-tRNA formyltransferase
MGTPEFAVASLEALVTAGHNVVGVVTSPDRPAGRGQQLHQSAVKQYALKQGLTLLQPEKLKDGQFLEELKDLAADLQIVVAFRMLPEVVWNMPKMGTYNLHASLLPKYRGAAPINWAVINGETETGVTTFKLKHEIDTGNILFREVVKIGETTTAGELHDELMQVGAGLIVKSVTAISGEFYGREELKFIKQEDAESCHAPKLFKDTCRIDWNKKAIDIYNLIRGLSPYPTAYTELSSSTGERLSLKIFFAEYELMPHDETNGSLVADNKSFLKVYCSDGMISIKELQLQGKKRMPVAEFLKGFKFDDAITFC